MPSVEIDGIATHYEIMGDGPPLLMFSPGGFDARIEQWSDLGIYTRIKLLDHLPKKYQCILFDRRENGRSGGRVEQITWGHYVTQASGLLDHLKIDRAHLMGGCMGCCPVNTFAVTHPERVISMVHYFPVGGAKYRISGHERFAQHLTFVEEQGLQAVVDLVGSHDLNFSKDPRGGPWGSVIRADQTFATAYAAFDVKTYLKLVSDMVKGMIDRDTSPGAEPEDLIALNTPALIIPGADNFHATSAARYLQECLSGSEYWDKTPDEQVAEDAPARVLTFLDKHS